MRVRGELQAARLAQARCFAACSAGTRSPADSAVNEKLAYVDVIHTAKSRSVRHKLAIAGPLNHCGQTSNQGRT